MTKLVGILNLTPDSFSDGGKYATLDAQLAALHQLIDDGADMVDIGAESTRPGATALSVDQEWQRLESFIASANPDKLPVPLSLDTYHPENARRALEHGFAVINDVSGFRYWEMIDAVASSKCQLVLMHSLTIPASKEITLPDELDVVAYLAEFATSHIARLAEQGIDRARIIFDPGIGFGKTKTQNQQIIDRIDELQAIDAPLYIGHSRKSFLDGDRDAATLAISKQLIAKGVDYLRVHDVAAHRSLL